MTQKTIRKMVATALVVFCFFAITVHGAMADDASVAVTAANAKMTEFFTQLKSIYNVVLNIAFPLSTIGLCWGALNALWGTQRELERAISGIKFTILALVAIILLPAAVSWTVGIFRATGWNPNNL